MPSDNAYERVARGLLVDALITFVAVAREKDIDFDVAFDAWSAACLEMHTRCATLLDPLATVALLEGDNKSRAENAEALLKTLFEGDEINEAIDEHVEALIEERRGLIRDTMREELAALADPDSSARDRADVQREMESGEDGA